MQIINMPSFAIVQNGGMTTVSFTIDGLPLKLVMFCDTSTCPSMYSLLAGGEFDVQYRANLIALLLALLGNDTDSSAMCPIAAYIRTLLNYVRPWLSPDQIEKALGDTNASISSCAVKPPVNRCLYTLTEHGHIGHTCPHALSGTLIRIAPSAAPPAIGRTPSACVLSGLPQPGQYRKCRPPIQPRQLPILPVQDNKPYFLVRRILPYRSTIIIKYNGKCVMFDVVHGIGGPTIGDIMDNDVHSDNRLAIIRYFDQHDHQTAFLCRQALSLKPCIMYGQPAHIEIPWHEHPIYILRMANKSGPTAVRFQDAEAARCILLNTISSITFSEA